MLRSILHTAYHPPLFHAQVYERERCLNKLEQGLDKRLIFVRAGAGFGKTSLMGLFYQTITEKKIWFSIPEGYFTCDKLFLHLVYGLLEHEEVQLYRKWEPTLHTMLMGILDREQVVMHLIHLLEELPREVYIFLDDFQNLQWNNREMELEGLQMLSRFAPRQVHFVIASREELPIPVHRLRQEAQLLELEERDLIFDRDELRQFLRNRAIDPEEEWLKWIWQKTEGWIAGVCLILYCFRENAEMQQVAGTIPPVKEYLSEILAAIPEQTRTFLQKTSIFETIRVDVCNEYLQIEDSQRILDELVEYRLLTHRYEEDGGYYYRYHNLLKEFYLAQLDVTTIQSYHVRLAETYHQRGEKEMEIAHWIAAGVDERAMELIKGDIPLRLDSSGLTLLNEWLDQLAATTETKDPFFYLYRGWMLSLQGRLNDSLTCYCQAETGLAEHHDWRNWAWVRIQIADLHWWLEQYENAYQICQETLQHPAVQQAELLAGLYNYIGMSAMVLKRKEEGVLYLRKAKELAAQCGDLDRESWVANYLAFGSSFADGKVEEAIELCQFALQNFKKVRNRLGMALTATNMGYFLLATHELSEAEIALDEAENLCQELNNVHLIRPVYAIRSMVAVAQGDLTRGEDYLHRLAESLQTPAVVPYFQQGIYILARARLHMKQREWAKAEVDLQEAGEKFALTGGDAGNFFAEYRITWILLHLFRGDPLTALEVAREVEEEAMQAGFAMTVHEVRFLIAIAKTNMGSMTAETLQSFHLSPYPFFKAKYAEWLPVNVHPLRGGLIEEDIPLRIRFLGDFRVEFGTRVITSHDWNSQKVSDLFKYLLLHHNQWIPLEDLLNQFWPESERGKAKQSLYVALYEIRRKWEPGLLKGKESKFVYGKRGMYRMELPRHYWCDVEVFNQHVTEGVQLYEKQCLTKASLYLQKALGLYAGDFLQENMYDEWTQRIRETYQKKYVDLLTTLALIYGEQGEYHKSLPLLRQALMKNPFEDQLHELMIRYWMELGQTNEAIQHFRDYDRMYQEELGVEMPMKIRTLYQKMVG